MGKNISIVGGGLVGSLLSLGLKQKGFEVNLYEKRADPRISFRKEGRSINLALSHRGILPLQKTGVYDLVKPFTVPMYGRMMHDVKGNLTFQAYGKENQFISSASRTGLNQLLISEAENAGVNFHFEQKCKSVDFKETSLEFANGTSKNSDFIIGADGAFSIVRRMMQKTSRFNYSQSYIEHGYKELTIPPKNGDFALKPNYLHIWPRGNFMLIALPNPDKSFTCTLFLPFEGDISFESLNSKETAIDFFEKYFRDALELMPQLSEEFRENPASSLVTIKCSPWSRNNSLVIGDASHAILPFYGQGMNSGFEDIYLLLNQLENNPGEWKNVMRDFSINRKADTDAIAKLAYNNFIEMSDHVSDPQFLLRKKLEAVLHEHFPQDWIPLYTMVTFSDMPYSKAILLGKLQKEVLTEAMNQQKVDSKEDLENIISELKSLRKKHNI